MEWKLLNPDRLAGSSVPEVVHEFPSDTLSITGSRSIGCAHKGSDWDFYCPHSPDLEKLEGWKPLPINDRAYRTGGSRYSDPLVYRVMAKANVHVQLIYPGRMFYRHLMQAYWEENAGELYRISKSLRHAEYRRVARFLIKWA